MQDHKSKIQNTNGKLTKYKLTPPPLLQTGIIKEYCTIFQYPDGCNVDQGSFIPATGHTHKQKIGCEHDLSPPITLTRP